MKNLVCLTFIFGIFTTSCLSPSELSKNEKSSSPSDRGEWNVRDHVPVGKFAIQSHRGAGVLAPENTLAAFALGWKLGTVPEADIRATKDGVIVSFHDGNFQRVVKNAGAGLQKKGVENVTFAELQKLDVGSWHGKDFINHRVPRLAEVFALMTGHPQRWLYLDIKQVDLTQLAAEVRAHQVERQVIFTSTKYELLRAWKKIIPESMTLHWMGGTEESLKKRIEDLRAVQFADITQLQLHVRLNTNSASNEPFNLSRAFLRASGEELRRHHVLYQALPWGVTDAQVYWQLLDLGVASFATDYPDVTRQAVRDYYAQKNPKSGRQTFF